MLVREGGTAGHVPHVGASCETESMRRGKQQRMQQKKQEKKDREAAEFNLA